MNVTRCALGRVAPRRAFEYARQHAAAEHLVARPPGHAPSADNQKHQQSQPDEEQQFRCNRVGGWPDELHARVEQLLAELGVDAFRAEQMDDNFLGSRRGRRSDCSSLVEDSGVECDFSSGCQRRLDKLAVCLLPAEPPAT